MNHPHRPHRPTLPLAAAALAALLAAPVLADHHATDASGSMDKPAMQLTEQQAQQAEKALVDMAAQVNLYEIEAAKVAKDKATSDAVRKLAETAGKDHRAAQDALKEAAEQAGHSVPTSLDELHQAKLAKLEKLPQGPMFDTAFAFGQAGGHETSVYAYRMAEATCPSDAIKQYAADVLPKLKKHGDKADEVSKQLLSDLGAADDADAMSGRSAQDGVRDDMDGRARPAGAALGEAGRDIEAGATDARDGIRDAAREAGEDLDDGLDGAVGTDGTALPERDED